MSKKAITYPLNEGAFMTLVPQQDQSINILRYTDAEDNPYNIIINRAALEPEQTVDDFCEKQWERMKRSVPGFEVEGKNLKHEIGPAKLPVLQTANKFLEDGAWVKQVTSIITLPQHPVLNPGARKLLVFTLATNGDFTEEQRKHYVRIINSFMPAEMPLNVED
ncbi:DcrB-related protein [Erwinia sp. HR93]|uniref:DcrB-related protein n=1 Tax=Erwinia sp. HR93 TaxID=3094840 RepID=UPI002ADEAFA3|nr:DcrB-related protein [Erwinia sp. HR93]MEA1064066.1 DcrB-related protein [Erwinia sp. HR93]